MTVASRFFHQEDRLIQRPAVVVHCRLEDASKYRSGLAFETLSDQKKQAAAPRLDERFTDYYETLQVSPNADIETI